MACTNDTDCVGIYDEGCDKDGPFLRIRKGFMSSKYGPNCVYKKKSYDGTKNVSETKYYITNIPLTHNSFNILLIIIIFDDRLWSDLF